MRCAWILVAAGVFACARAASPGPVRPPPSLPDASGLALPSPVARGVSYAHDWSAFGTRGYGTASDRAQLARLRALGATWVSVMPFAYLAGASSTRVRAAYARPGSESDAAVAATVAAAHAQGLHVLLKPHLWVEGSWPGALRPPTDAAQRELMDTWSEVTLHYADLAARTGAEALSIGVEMDEVARARPELFRTLAARVRARCRATLTYGANWNTAHEIVFWDALDVVGVQDYVPLAERATVDRREVLRRAEAALARFAAIGQRVGRPVWLTEVGFRRDVDALREPWAWPDPRAPATRDDALQALGLEATFRAVARAPAITGVFLWKHFTSGGTEDEGDRGFVFMGGAGEAVVRAAFALPPAPPPP